MNTAYKFTDMQVHSDLLKELTRLEQELSQKYGHNIVLIAYSSSEK